MSDPIVAFEGVSKSYDGRTDVVKSLDLAIARGEFLTLLGPSGSGKTTTLMMLAGFEEPTAGTITLEGRRLNNVPAHRRGIGMVFQNYALFPHMTVAENLAFPLEMHGAPKGEIPERVKRALEMVRLGNLGNRKPAQLSGGQQQRVAVARALVYEPKLVLMDEPLGALDKQLRERMQIEIRHLHQNLGLTVVYVTHDQTEALTMSDRIAVFQHGVVEQIARPEEIYDAPANAFVASFIGENNRLDGEFVDREGALARVRLADGTVLVAKPVADLPAGAPVVLSIRPERVQIGDDRDGPNSFTARVEEVIYLGDHCRVRVAFGGNGEFCAKRPHADGAPPPARGDVVTVSWRPESCLALPAASNSSNGVIA
jgi:putative spermidine/putrescine transport system ATP-binding protein